MSTSITLPVEAISTPTPSTQPETPAEPTPFTQPQSSAIQHCMDAWNQRYRAVLTHEKNTYTAERLAGDAYRAAMPELTSPANLRDFIACVTRGILLGAIDDKRASKLLYAAQVASGVLNRQPKPDNSKSPSKAANCEL